jgi:hypothetical protein
MTNRNRRYLRSLRIERFESRQLLAGDLGGSPTSVVEDINGDGRVTAVDALMVINQMSREKSGQSPSDLSMDLNGDGIVGAGDALRIINRIARDRLARSFHPIDSPEVRSIDGIGNNLENSHWGAVGIEFVRLVDADYADGTGLPPEADRPSARVVSNLVADQQGSIPSENGLSDLIWQWGQFIDHDIDLTREGDGESFNVLVPSGDPMFDPLATGDAEIGLVRSASSEASGTGIDNPRQQVNDITAFIDGSMIYGSDVQRAKALRLLSSGRLKTSEGELLPFNELGLANAGGTGDSLFLAGDIRANEQVGLTSMHTLWVREHNRIADAIAAQDHEASDESIYQQARAMVIGEIQVITFNEYLPAVLGQSAIATYSGYDATVDPSISNLFATAVYRYGHTQLSSELLRLNNDGSEIDSGNLALRDAFFNPGELLAEGIDPILKGLATGVAQAIDTYIVDDVRNFLFGPPGSGGFDLASLNIQRGRDHGLADYNTVRAAVGLRRAASFADITADVDLQSRLELAYKSVDAIDVWVGALAEDHVPGASVGELLRKTISDQFTAIRDGDRFWYENTFSGTELNNIRQTQLSDVIQRNTELTTIQPNAFLIPVAEPDLPPDDEGPPLASRQNA